jgi:hypothetical protein
MSDLLICIDRRDFPSRIPHPDRLPPTSPLVLCGPTEFLLKKRVAVLNSRQSPRLTKENKWIHKTLEALQCLDSSQTVLVSSLGTVAWEVLTWAGGKLGFPIILVFPAGSAQGFKISRTRAIMNLGLDTHKTLALRPLLLKKYCSKVEINRLRDNWIMAVAETFLPISIKPKGNLDRLLRRVEPDIIHRTFGTLYETAAQHKKTRIPESIRLPDWYQPDEFLIHWTRSCVGSWPDETQAKYFERRLDSNWDEMDGLDTIHRILSGGCIHASGRLIRGKHPVVPFTERPPDELHDLIKWRAGLRRWTFEPYGIALRKSKLIELGVRPAIYGELTDYEAMPEGDRPFFQMQGKGKHDWREEKEWRIAGDVSLDAFEKEELVVIVPDGNDASTLIDKTDYSVLALAD